MDGESSPPPWRPRSGSPESSERTQVAILQAAQGILVSKGYAQFTLRAVAAEAGITVGNLSYHFKSKRQLLRSIIATMIAGYSEKITEVFQATPGDHDSGLTGLISWLIQDATRPDTVRLGREIWAMALHDPYVAEALDKFYADTIALSTELILRRYPNLPAARARAVAALTAIISEGTIAIYGTSSARKPPLPQVNKVAAEAIIGIVGRD